MKKISVLILTLALIFTLSACNMANGGGANGNSQLINDSSIVSDPITSNTVSGTTPLADTTPKLTKDEALNVALKRAGVKREDIRELENNLDLENGVLVYEIEFKVSNKEYSFDIGANDGKIIYEKTELDD